MTKPADGQQRENANNMLYNAAKIITTQRGNQHGGAEDSFQTIGDLWTILLRQATTHRRGGEEGIVTIDDLQITPADVAHMMNILKIARAIHGDPLNEDNYIDAAGYAALAGSLSLGDKRITKIGGGPTEVAQAAVDELKAKQESDRVNRELQRKRDEAERMRNAAVSLESQQSQRAQSLIPQVDN